MHHTLQRPIVIPECQGAFQTEWLFNKTLGRFITLRWFCQSAFPHVQPEGGRINFGIYFWKSRVFKLNHTHMQRKSGLLLDLLAGKQELPLQTPWIFPCTIKAPSATSNISQEAFVVIFSSCLEHFVCFFVPLQWVQSTHLAVSETGSAVTVWKKKNPETKDVSHWICCCQFCHRIQVMI